MLSGYSHWASILCQTRNWAPWKPCTALISIKLGGSKSSSNHYYLNKPGGISLKQKYVEMSSSGVTLSLCSSKSHQRGIVLQLVALRLWGCGPFLSCGPRPLASCLFCTSRWGRDEEGRQACVLALFSERLWEVVMWHWPLIHLS